MCARRAGRLRIGALESLAAPPPRPPPHAPAVVEPTSAAAATAPAGTTPTHVAHTENTAAVSSWSIQAALQVAYPPLPLVLGFQDGPLRWPVIHPLARPSSSCVVVPQHSAPTAVTGDALAGAETRAGDAQRLQSIFDEEVHGAATRAQAGRRMLRDVRTLPWSAGSGLTAALASVARVQLRAGGVYDAHGPSPTPAIDAGAHARVRPPRPPPSPRSGADGPHDARHRGCDGVHVTEAAAWRASCEYVGPQPCAEASAVSLRSFAVAQQQHEQQQQRPMVVFAAERACRSGDGDAGGAQEDSTRPTSAAALGGAPPCCLPSWIPPTMPVHRLPVEVYAERAPLLHVGGTAALQLRFRQLQLQRHAHEQTAALTTSSQMTTQPEARRWPLPPGAHLVWTGRCWVAETDTQLVDFEERLLAALAPAPTSSKDAGASPGQPPPHPLHPHRISPVRPVPGVPRSRPGRSTSTATSTRLWLPGRWRAPAAFGWWRTLSLELPGHADGRDAGETEGWLSLRRTSPAALSGPRCTQWVVRLRKLWAVCGVADGVRLRGGGSSSAHGHRHDERDPAAALHAAPSGPPTQRSCSLHTARAVEAATTVRYPNYDLMSGAPLDLHGLHRGLAATPAPHHRRAGRTPRAAATPEMPVTPPSHRTDHPLAGMAPPVDHPLLCAVLSRQVAWIPLYACGESGVRGSRTGAPAAAVAAASWQLPDALRVCYEVPRTAAQVPHPELCSGPASPATRVTTLPPRSSAAHPMPRTPLLSSPPLPPACLTVPQRQWWTGFFLHDAPAWWQREVALTSTPPTTCGSLDADARSSAAQCRAAGNELEALLQVLWADGGIPPLPGSAGELRAAVDWRGSRASSSSEVAATATASSVPSAVLPPRVCLLHLAPVAPTVHGAVHGTRCAKDAGLQWTVLPATAAVTVNHFFSLDDVVRVSAADDRAAPPQTPPVLLFIEVKAALEVLLRRQRPRTPPGTERATDASASPWWACLSAFHAANAFAVDGAGQWAAAAQEGEAGDGVSGAAAEDEAPDGADAITESRRDVVTALAHPSVTELVCAWVSLLLRSMPAPVATWTRTTYNALLERACSVTESTTEAAAAAATAAAAGTTTDEPRDGSDGRPAPSAALETVEEAGSGCAAADAVARGEGAGVDDDGDAASSAGASAADIADVGAALPSLPHGAAVRRYDEDGTRCADTSGDGGGGEWRDDRFRISRTAVHGAARHRGWTLGADHRLNEGSLLRILDTEGSLAFAGSPVGGSAGTAVDTAATKTTALDTRVADAIAAACEAHRSGFAVDALEGTRGGVNTGEDGADGIEDGSDRAAPDAPQTAAATAHRRGRRRGAPPDSALQRRCRPPRWARAGAAAAPDALERLVTAERRGFARAWHRLLKYVPRRTNDAAAPGSPGVSPASATSSSPPPSGNERGRVDLLHLFPFLQPSAAEEHCVAVGAACRDTASATPADPDDVAVVVPDLGLCVLHVERADVFVNAANLLYRE